MNEQIFIVLAEETKNGGLFDIGATLPLVLVQFLMLMSALNLVLYQPLIYLATERNEYIMNNLNQASEIILMSSKLMTQYETELNLTKKEAKNNILQIQKLYKENFDNELKISQKSIDKVVQNILEKFKFKKRVILNNIKTEVNILSKEIFTKLFK